ncbi:MAG: dTDP-4-dehydrorhamnose 3,5-epimerase [Actinomycetales bacterium]|nr:MAG: dTDP-4-dehydrorhamnose 3,5-epimerase [Actinomycetales bacterium]
MIFHPTPVKGAFVVELEPNADDRGWFARAFCQEEFRAAGIDFVVCQANLSGTAAAGTIRGLHFIAEPPEQKLVRCTAGAVWDVMIDMRPESPTYRESFATRLDAASGAAVFVPAGVAHGYQTLTDDVQFLYLTDFVYRPGLEQGVRYDDPQLGAAWPIPVSVVSDRDRGWPSIRGD